jgi:LysR family transcriptional regulator, glycine cleavage system transcriptional activator
MTDRLPPLNALRAFEASARHLSFAKAAQELGVTPGAISQQIRILEDAVGIMLFRRTGRSVLLTEAAQAALPVLREGFDKLQESARIMRVPIRRTRLTVSVAPSFASKWLMPRLDKFQDAHPEIEVWVSADMSNVDFTTADVDLAVRYGGGVYDGLKSERLMGEAVLPVCAPRLVEEGLKTPADLARFALIHDGGPEGDPTCPDWKMWLRARGLDEAGATKGLRLNQTSLVIEAAVKGSGVALAKRTIAQDDLTAGRLVAPFAGEPAANVSFAYWLVWPKGRTISPPMQAFMKWLRSEADWQGAL